MKANKERTLDRSKPVRVYRNIRRDVYSVQQKGLVVAHGTALALRDCQFVVNEAGRQRVLAEKRKNVHAYVKGFVLDGIPDRDGFRRVTYNPYKMDQFAFADTLEPLSDCSIAVFLPEGLFVQP